MKYVLDTDTMIYFLKGRESVTHSILKHSLKELTTTIINQTELLFGAYHSSKREHNLTTVEGLLSNLHVIPFCNKSSHIFAEQKALLIKQGHIIPDMDLLIASIVLCHQGTLVTNNTKHFARIKKLKLENWCTP